MSKIQQPMTHFEKYKVQMMRHEINAALEIVGNKFGVDFRIGSIKYSPNEFHGKLTCTTRMQSDGSTFDPTVQAFENYARIYGLDKDDLGKKFISNGQTFVLTGAKPRNRKYPLLGKEVGTGAPYKFTKTQVQRGLEVYKERYGG